VAGKPNQALPELGPLERAALEYLWESGEADVIGTHAALARRTGISVNTIGSALERLYKKGLLQRSKVSHAYVYKPALTRSAFFARQVLDSAGGFKSLADSGLLSSFLDVVADVDSKALDQLEELIAKKRQEKKR
jgi:predicted transcriptional regulator